MLSAETVGVFTAELADGSAGSNATASEKQAQNVSTSVFIMFNGSRTAICQMFMQKKVSIKK
jgi:hypothetical protein